MSDRHRVDNSYLTVQKSWCVFCMKLYASFVTRQKVDNIQDRWEKEVTYSLQKECKYFSILSQNFSMLIARICWTINSITQRQLWLDVDLLQYDNM